MWNSVMTHKYSNARCCLCCIRLYRDSEDLDGWNLFSPAMRSLTLHWTVWAKLLPAMRNCLKYWKQSLNNNSQKEKTAQNLERLQESMNAWEICWDNNTNNLTEFLIMETHPKYSAVHCVLVITAIIKKELSRSPPLTIHQSLWWQIPQQPKQKDSSPPSLSPWHHINIQVCHYGECGFVCEHLKR